MVWVKMNYFHEIFCGLMCYVLCMCWTPSRSGRSSTSGTYSGPTEYIFGGSICLRNNLLDYTSVVSGFCQPHELGLGLGFVLLHIKPYDTAFFYHIQCSTALF